MFNLVQSVVCVCVSAHAHLLRSHMWTVFPEAEKRVSPLEATKTSCTTASEVEEPLPVGGLGGDEGGREGGREGRGGGRDKISPTSTSTVHT